MANIEKHLYLTKRYLKQNAPTILSGLGVVGVATTTIMGIKATPKAIDILEHVEEVKGEKLTKFESVRYVLPVYFPTILMGTATAACILGANTLNKQQQAVLTSAYGYLDATFKEYRGKVNELYGEDADKKVRDEIAKDRYETRPIPEGAETRLFYDQIGQRYFEATLNDIQNAMYHANRLYNLRGIFSLNELYDCLNLPRLESGEVLGWSAVKDWEVLGSSWIDIRWESMIMSDGVECLVLDYSVEPSNGFQDY